MGTETTTLTPLLEQYDRHLHIYEAFAAKLETLVRDIIGARSIQIHSVTSRVKTRNSLRQKVLRPSATYQEIEDITDLVGVRAICYFADDVDRVADVLESEFQIDTANTVDKRDALDPDQFGYLSLHHIVSLKSTRSALPEYATFTKLKAEIQTRSILQHSWAEIEHDLGYKTSIEVPKHLRRRFARIAGLLELADSEFADIRDALSRYKAEVPKTIDDEPEQVLLDLASVRALIERNPLIRMVDEEISAAADTPLSENTRGQDGILQRLQFAGTGNVSELISSLETYRKILPPFAKLLVKERGAPKEQERSFAFGISLFYLAYVLMMEGRTDEDIDAFLRSARVTYSAEYLRGLYNRASAAVRF
jgi:putative GTP pyrophosphokinase